MEYEQIKKTLTQVLQAMDTLEVKGFHNTSTLSGCMHLLSEMMQGMPCDSDGE